MPRGKPGRSCSICIHPHRARIERDLLEGRPQHRIAREHKVSADALSRHSLRHISAAPAAHSDPLAGTIQPGDIDLLGDVLGLRTRLLKLLTKAEKDRDIRGGLLAIREAIRLVETVGKLTGQIDASGVRVAVQVNNGAGDTQTIQAVRDRIAAKLAALATGLRVVDGTAE